MKSDLKLYYFSGCDQQIQVEANIEGVELRTAEFTETVDSKPQTYLNEDDVKELIEMLKRALEHHALLRNA